jgi:hypothetical protein
MWEPQHLTTLRVFTACYRDSFTFLLNQETGNDDLSTKLVSIKRDLNDEVNESLNLMSYLLTGKTEGPGEKTLSTASFRCKTEHCLSQAQGVLII